MGGTKKKDCGFELPVSPLQGSLRDQIKVLSCWPELKACVKRRLKIAVSFLLCVYFGFFFEWVVAILVVSEHPAAWSVVKLRTDVVASHFVSI